MSCSAVPAGLSIVVTPTRGSRPGLWSAVAARLGGGWGSAAGELHPLFHLANFEKYLLTFCDIMVVEYIEAGGSANPSARSS